MKTKGSIFLLIFLLSCCGKSWAEPNFQGKTLSAWLDEYGAGPGNYKPSPEADDALRYIGPDAVPFLLEMLRMTNLPAVDNELRLIGAGKKVGTNTSNFIPASWFHWKAYLGFHALKSAGKSAIPDLSKLAFDDPEGTSFYPNIWAMTNVVEVAKLADNSSTYVSLCDGPYFGPNQNYPRGTNQLFISERVMRNTKPFLVDGEIAAWSLAAIGADAVPSLMKLLDDSSPHLKERAVEALGLVGTDAGPAVPEILNNLKGSNRDVRIRAADALGHIGTQQQKVIPALTFALKDSDIGVKCYAADSLGLYGTLATDAVPALLESFGESDWRIRQSASTALGKISPDVTMKEVVPSLLRQLDDPNSWHNGALMDLLQLDLKPDLMVPHLIKALTYNDGNDKSIQMNAIRGLGKYGPAAKDAVPKLVPLLADGDYFIREHTTNALDKIDPGWRKNH